MKKTCGFEITEVWSVTFYTCTFLFAFKGKIN